MSLVQASEEVVHSLHIWNNAARNTGFRQTTSIDGNVYHDLVPRTMERVLPVDALNISSEALASHDAALEAALKEVFLELGPGQRF